MIKFQHNRKLQFFTVLFIVINLPSFVFAQGNYRSTGVYITVSGTSSLHDWSEKSNSGTAAATFVITNDKITGLPTLMFTLPAKSLKSEHKAMDNNTYKALKTDKHANITFAASSSTITPATANTYTVKTKGKLTIAGTTKETEVTGTAKLNADKSITINGSKKIKMTDYNVTPPTAMLGSIRTGNDLTISYNLKFVK